MKRIFALECKRIALSRTTLVLAVGALILSIAAAFLVVSFPTVTFLNEAGERESVSGREAIPIKQELYQPLEGLMTPDKIKAAFETYHAVYETVGEGNDIPDEVYYRRLYPLSPLISAVRAVYVDASTGTPIPLRDLSPEAAADFYTVRTERLRQVLSDSYADRPEVVTQALAMNAEVETPFTYNYGIGDSDSGDYLALCIFLLVMIAAVMAAPTFSGGYQTGVDDILRCTKHGRQHLARIKMGAALLIVAGIFVVCTATFLAISCSAFGWGSLSTSLQAAFSAISFASLTVGEAYALVLLSGLLSLLATTCFTLFLSSLCKNPLTTLCGGIFVCLLPTVLSIAGSGSAIEQWLTVCLPSGGIGLTNSFFYELNGLHFLPLGTVSIWTPFVIPVAAALESILFFWLAVWVYVRHEVA